MGFECDQEMVQMIGTEESVLIKLFPCIEEGHQAQVYTQNQVHLCFGFKSKFHFFSDIH